MSLFPELDRLTPEQLQDSFRDPASSQGHGEEAAFWLDEVAFRIARNGTAGIRFLLESIPTADEYRLHSILVGLSSNPSKLPSDLQNESWGVGCYYLNDARPMIIAQAVDLLSLRGCTAAHDGVLKLCHHSSPFVVGSVLRYMSRLFPEEALPLLEEALASHEPIVRQNAIDELDDLNYVKALPAIKRLTKDNDRDVRQAARTAVKNLEEAG
jgi:hypothetical protein